MAGENVQGALQSLKDERDRLDEAIAALEMLIAEGRRRRGRPRKHPPKRPSLLASSPPKQPLEDRSPGRRRKNAPRGLLRARIREVLAHAKRPVAPIELRNAVLASGYPTKSPKTLYSAVFAAAKADPQVKKTQDGFLLR